MLWIVACEPESTPFFTFAMPSQGQNVNLGDEVKLQLEVPKEVEATSITYLVDDQLLGVFKGNQPVVLPTKNLRLGYRMLTAIVKFEGKADTIRTNLVIKNNKAPLQLGYQLVKSFPHDTSAYTEGLSYVDGRLLESTGENGRSELKWVDLASGKTLQRTKLAPKYFGEGSLKIGNKIIMLTWKENIGFIFDAKTFAQLGTFPYQNSREGWGLTFDGKQIMRSDGTNRIWLMNAENFKEESYIEVYDDKGPVNSLNELEFIDGKIYANIYPTSNIVRIDPVTGAVEAMLDLNALAPKNYYRTPFEVQNNVLNGIAWDEKGKRLFVGGKKWPKLYQIKLTETLAK